MSEDEGLLLVVSLLCAGGTWWAFAVRLLRVGRLGRGRARRGPLALAPLAVVAILLPVLGTLASADVVGSPGYVFLYLVFGLAFVGAVVTLLPLVGIDARGDVAERGNGAAAWLVGGAALGTTFAFTGGNVGDGPGWWVVLFCAVLSTATLFGTFLLANGIGRFVERVSVDRDPSAGLRGGALLVALGLVLGRAVAGDWHSAGETISDFLRVGWPAAAIAVLAGILERRIAVRAEPQGSPDRDAAIASVAFVGAALVVLALAGRPS